VKAFLVPIKEGKERVDVSSQELYQYYLWYGNYNSRLTFI